MKRVLRLFVVSILVLGLGSVQALPDFLALSGSRNEIYCPGWIDFGGVLDGATKVIDDLWNPDFPPEIPPSSDEDRAKQGIPQNSLQTPRLSIL